MLLLLVSEGGSATATQDVLAIGEGDINEDSRGVANGRGRATALVEGADQRLRIGVDGQVEDRTVAAWVEDGLELLLARDDVGQLQGVLDPLLGLRVGKELLRVGVLLRR